MLCCRRCPTTTMMSCKTLPETVTGTTVDDQCGSSQQTCHFAAQAIMSGTHETVYVETDDWDDVQYKEQESSGSKTSADELTLCT